MLICCDGHLELDRLQKLKGYRCALDDYVLQGSLKFFQWFRRYFDNRHTETWSKMEFLHLLVADNNWYIRLKTFSGEQCFIFFFHIWTPHFQCSHTGKSRFPLDLPSNVCYCGISPTDHHWKAAVSFFIPKLPRAFPLAAETNISGFN